jgi:glycerophosphoryl diester phosphodiesterase
MERVDTRVILVAGSGDFSSGFDTPEDFDRIPGDFSGGIWTDRVDRIAPLLQK